MSISALSAAKYLCQKSDWSLTNLKLQKILYIAHMVSIRREPDDALIKECFEAWAYGPVIPALYHKVKIFGSSPIKDIFRSYSDLEKESNERKILDDAFKHLSKLSAGELVDITHRKDGAWEGAYIPRENIRISNESIESEYNMIIS